MADVPRNILIGFGIALLFALCVWAAIADEKAFAQYRLEHHCTITGVEEGYNLYNYVYDKDGGHTETIWVPARTHFQCDTSTIVRSGDYR